MPTLVLGTYLAASVAAQTPPPGPRMMPVRQMMAPLPPAAFEGEGVTIPMTLDKIIPVVDIRIAGEGPYRFAIDTGAFGHGRIRPEVAAALGLTVVGEARAGDGSGRSQVRKNYAVPSLTVAGVTFKDLQITEMAVPPGNGRLDGIDGILGISLFAQHTLKIDYASQRMALSRAPLSPSAISYPAAPGPITIPIMIGGKTVPAHLDTGNAVAPLIVPAVLAGELPTRGMRRRAGTAATAVSTVEIWEIDLSVPVRVGSLTLPVNQITYPSLGAAANLGSKALATSILRVDQRNRRVSIEPGNLAVSRPESRRSR